MVLGRVCTLSFKLCNRLYRSSVWFDPDFAGGGSSWSSIAYDCRSANRNYTAPADRDFDLGFRLLRTID